ncbi:MAG: family 20 glycosylhydrolase, partial [Woeseiaceae bacterium]
DRQFRITDNERIEWATSSVLYSVNQQTPAQPIDVTTSVIPSPASVEHNDTRAVLDLVAGIRVSLQGFARDDVEAALKRLDKLGVTENPAGVVLTITENRNGAEHRDSYSISIGHDAIDISASDAAGAFYALQTLAGLVRLDETTVPQLQIDDQPRYGFRGLHIDLARNFHSLELLTRIVEQMGAYKLNKLHLHLGDDEGWRLEIPGLAELTEVGSRRCHDPSESRCLLPQLGAGPHGDSPVNGYLTTAEYAQLLQYAAARHVQVIPSFDMPGHSRAAVKSMEARYRNLVDRGDETGAGLYLLSDLDDASVYNSIQNYTDNTINVCMESSYRFVTKVIDEVQAIHRDAGVPLTRYHVGADETAGAWRDSPACAGFLAGNEYGVRDVSELGAYFIEHVAAILEARGIETAGWGDGLGHTDVENMPAVVQSNAWGRLIDPAHVSAHRHVNHGWEVVLSIPDVAYFDFPYEADPAERGFYWASRQLNTRKVFEFMPDNLPAHAEFWADSEGLDMQLTDNEPMQAGRGFVGVQGQTWSETLRSDEQVEYMLFPRLLALAERAWHRASWEVPYDYEGGRYDRASGRFTEAMRAERDTDWNRFANVVSAKELAKLDAYGIDYRIPTVGAVIRNGRLHCNLIFPGLAIEYRVDGGAWQSCETPVAVNGERVDVRALSADGGRPGRSLRVR